MIMLIVCIHLWKNAYIKGADNKKVEYPKCPFCGRIGEMKEVNSKVYLDCIVYKLLYAELKVEEEQTYNEIALKIADARMMEPDC